MIARGCPRRVVALCALAAVLAACGGSDSSTPSTSALDDTADEPSEAEPTTSPTTAPAATTAPPTTAAPTTVPPTTAPPTTAPPTTAPPTTVPPLAPELVQFCFDSEQAYVAVSVTDSMSDSPTVDQARAALQFLVFTAETAAASAPPGYADEPTRFAQISNDIDALFAQYEYDTAVLVANEDFADHEPMFDEFDTIVEDQLVPFLVQVCGTPVGVLEDQATKIAAVIDQAVTWPLVAVANKVGDIRLLAPDAWAATLGSTERAEVTTLEVTPDIEAFENTWTVPGVRVQVFYVEAGTAEPTLRVPQSPATNDCSPLGKEPYTDPVYTGDLYLYHSCADTDTGAAVLAVTNAEGSTEVYLEFQFPEGIDRPLLDQIAATFVAGV